MRGPDLDASVWGVRRALELESGDAFERLVSRCELFAARMPEHALFSHVTAARLLGVPLPPQVERRAELDIAVNAPRRAPHAEGIRGHSLRAASRDLRHTRGLAHTGPARTWLDLGAELGLHDLVAAGDFLVSESAPLSSTAEIARLVARSGRRRGSANIQRALLLLDGLAESRPESILRVIVRLAYLPTPTINRQRMLADGGSQVRVDLTFERWKVAVEYQGDYHRTSPGQWRRDMTRRSRLEAAGWYVIELNADDLRDPDELARRIRSVLIRRGWGG